MASSSSEQNQGTPSFFKILFDPSTPYLQLPPDFVRIHLKGKIPENPTLEIGTGEHSWPLKIKELRGNYCFVNGWRKVVEDSQLGFGDFLLFWLISPSTFHLSVFSPSGCEKDLSDIFTNEKPDSFRKTTSSSKVDDDIIKIEDDDNDVDDKNPDVIKIDEDDEDLKEDIVDDENPDVIKIDEDDEDLKEEDDGDHNNNDAEKENKDEQEEDEDDENLSFRVIMPNSIRYQAWIPPSFVRKSKIGRKDKIMVENKKGEEWCVKIRKEIRKENNDNYYYLSAGWAKFCKDNRFSGGDVCIFDYVKSKRKCKLVVSKVIKRKLCGRRLSARKRGGESRAAVGAAKRKRGRPNEVKNETEVGKRKRGSLPVKREPDATASEDEAAMVKRRGLRPRRS